MRRRGLIETLALSILAVFGSGAAFVAALSQLQGCVPEPGALGL